MEVPLPRLTLDQLWAVAEVLGRVTDRQLRRMGLDARARAELDEAHEVLVQLIDRAPEEELEARQLVLHLRPKEPEEHAANARAFALAGRANDAMTELGRAFGVLTRLAPAGLDPFRAADLARWLARESPQSPAVRHAARFLLCVSSHERGTFDALAALATWDEADRRAFAAWARAPWLA